MKNNETNQTNEKPSSIAGYAAKQALRHIASLPERFNKAGDRITDRMFKEQPDPLAGVFPEKQPSAPQFDQSSAQDTQTAVFNAARMLSPVNPSYSHDITQLPNVVEQHQAAQANQVIDIRSKHE